MARSIPRPQTARTYRLIVVFGPALPDEPGGPTAWRGTVQRVPGPQEDIASTAAAADNRRAFTRLEELPALIEELIESQERKARDS